MSTSLRVVTYNIHKCRGMDRRVCPERIVSVLREVDADVIALQEVFDLHERGDQENHAKSIADQLGLSYCFGETEKRNGWSYGNAVISRFPIGRSRVYDVSAGGREPRGCLRADIQLPGGSVLHVFNVHLGTAFLERRKQARKLVSSDILTHAELHGARVVLGDFNEWTRGLTTTLLRSHFVSPDVRHHLKRSRTYPGVCPVLHLDHIYFDPAVRLRRFALHRTKRALVASDHLPLVADLLVMKSQAAAA